ncbi:hypothetical protein HY29_03340 [Hyphomonas beringensis]|uniref:Uncharacterized protein n=1 Tax=Hyphomonas beringensis TaxID=1280946 RepID=A0A062U1E5_9PROT|nr:hypothetical protein HY29_03340 [Hyphomonas beringensis]
MVRRWSSVRAALILCLITGSVWGVGQVRLHQKAGVCLDRGGAWDHDAHKCLTK